MRQGCVDKGPFTSNALAAPVPRYLIWIVNIIFSSDAGNLDGGVKCATCEMPGHCLWGYSWSIRALRFLNQQVCFVS